MKRIFAIVCMAIVMMAAANQAGAQCAFPEGTLGINIGFGVGTSSGHHNYSNHWSDKMTVPSINAAIDYAFLPNIINSNGCISGGAYVSLGHASSKSGDWKDMVNQWKVGTRGALHYTWVRNLDTYAGVGLGAKHEGWSGKHVGSGDKTPKDSKTDFDGYGFGGARYMIGNFAVYSELCTTNFAWFQIGISLVF